MRPLDVGINKMNFSRVTETKRELEWADKEINQFKDLSVWLDNSNEIIKNKKRIEIIKKD